MNDRQGKGQSEIMSKQHTAHPSPEFDQENNERLAKQSRDKAKEEGVRNLIYQFIKGYSQSMDTH